MRYIWSIHSSYPITHPPSSLPPIPPYVIGKQSQPPCYTEAETVFLRIQRMLHKTVTRILHPDTSATTSMTHLSNLDTCAKRTTTRLSKTSGSVRSNHDVCVSGHLHPYAFFRPPITQLFNQDACCTTTVTRMLNPEWRLWSVFCNPHTWRHSTIHLYTPSSVDKRVP